MIKSHLSIRLIHVAVLNGWKLFAENMRNHFLSYHGASYTSHFTVYVVFQNLNISYLKLENSSNFNKLWLYIVTNEKKIVFNRKLFFFTTFSQTKSRFHSVLSFPKSKLSIISQIQVFYHFPNPSFLSFPKSKFSIISKIQVFYHFPNSSFKDNKLQGRVTGVSHGKPRK